MRRKAEKGLKACSTSYGERLLELISELAVEPIPYKVYDVSMLEGTENTYRVRIGDVRVVYRVFWLEKVVEITFVGFRGKAYKGS